MKTPVPAENHPPLLREIAQLKHAARIYYETYTRLTGNYSCGAQLVEYINPEAATARKNYENVLKVLREIDPNFPKGK